jgi:hypothetical protein
LESKQRLPPLKKPSSLPFPSWLPSFLKRPGPLCYDLGPHCAMSLALCYTHSALNHDVHCATRPLAGGLCYENVSKSVTDGVCGPPRSTLNRDVQCAMGTSTVLLSWHDEPPLHSTVDCYNINDFSCAFAAISARAIGTRTLKFPLMPTWGKHNFRGVIRISEDCAGLGTGTASLAYVCSRQDFPITVMTRRGQKFIWTTPKRRRQH